jgi:peptide/nickel transport system permease protein
MIRKYLLKKLMYALLTLFGVLVINFFLFRIMPGDPISMLVRNPNANVEAVARIRGKFGLDETPFVQFSTYIVNLIKGDFGMSFHYSRPVLGVIGERVFATVLLVGTAEIVAIIIGVFLGILAAHRRGTKIDVGALSFSLITYAMPSFWLGIFRNFSYFRDDIASTLFCYRGSKGGRYFKTPCSSISDAVISIDRRVHACNEKLFN